MRTFGDLVKKSKASLLFILITVFLDMVGLGLVIPVLPDVIRRFSDDPQIVSKYFGYFFSIYALMQFLSAPILGSLSDSLGRRPILLVSLILAAVDYLLMGFAPTLGLLFLGRMISGLTGANFTVAMSYVADVTLPEKRSQSFGLIGAAFGTGFIVGPALGGLLAQQGPSIPFVVAGILNFLNFLYGIFVLPESLPLSHRRPFSFKSFNPLSPLKVVSKYGPFLPLIFGHFLIQLAALTHPSIWSLYTQTRFGWSKAQVGMSLAAVGVTIAFGQGYLTKVLIPKFGEKFSMIWGTLLYALFMSFYGIAWEGWMIFVVLIFGSVTSISQPALQSIVTQRVGPDRQGELQGVLVSLTSLAAILNPIIVTQLFAHFGNSQDTFYVPGAPYFFAATSAFLAFFCLWNWGRKP